MGGAKFRAPKSEADLFLLLSHGEFEVIVPLILIYILVEAFLLIYIDHCSLKAQTLTLLTW